MAAKSTQQVPEADGNDKTGTLTTRWTGKDDVPEEVLGE